MYQLIIVLVILFIVGIVTIGSVNGEARGLSEPSAHLYKEFMALPLAHRPAVDIKAALIALDVKHGKREARNHFHEDVGGFRWNSTCYSDYSRRHGQRCRFYDYVSLHDSIEGVKKELAEQEHQLALSNVENGLDSARSLIDILRQERELISDATKMIVGE